MLPLLLAAASVGLLRGFLKRGRGQSIFAAYFIFAAIDAALTLLIYVVPLMGSV
jgi:hypothetical protein